MFTTKIIPKNQLLNDANKFIWQALDWLYPPSCCNCHREGSVFCGDCQSQIQVITGKICKKCGYPLQEKNKVLCSNCRSNPPPFTQMRSWAAFSGPLRKSLHTMKYGQNLALGSLFALPLIKLLHQYDWPIDLVIPVPLSPGHHRKRGYNQAALISRAVARELNLEHDSTSLKRVKETESQISLNVNKRFTNLMDAFYAKPAKLKARNILLIDDVVTTGATMQNCTIALQQAGTHQVFCLSVARTILQNASDA